MASIPCALIALLICLSQDHMGVQGVAPVVFSSVAGNATLPCRNVVYPDCSSSLWDYTNSKDAVELVNHGKINRGAAKHRARAKRLSLDSDCSLHITDVTTEDAGLYTCLQYLREGGRRHGEVADVSLSVLKVSASPNETEMEADSNVTLHCLLHTPDNCGESVADEGVRLSWVDETGKELQNNTIPQTRTTSPCSITLTEELRGPNPVHTWTCRLTAGGQVQTSVSHSIRVKVVHVAVSVATTISLFVAVIIIVIIVVIIVAVIYRMRSGRPQGQPNPSAHSVYSAVASPSS